MKRPQPRAWPTPLTPFFVICGICVGSLLTWLGARVYPVLQLEGLILIGMAVFVFLAGPTFDCAAAHWHQRNADAARTEGRQDLCRAALRWLDENDQHRAAAD